MARDREHTATFIKNVRSLSTDPIVVRAKWIDVLNYVTDRGAQTLNDYAHDANPFMKIGLRPVAVEVIYISRASKNSFESLERRNIRERNDSEDRVLHGNRWNRFQAHKHS